MTQKIQKVFDGKKLVAVIRKDSSPSKGIDFLTDESNPLQFATHNYSKAKESRVHGLIKIRPIKITSINKFIHIQSGKITVIFYKNAEVVLSKHTLKKKDSIVIFDVMHKVIFEKNTKAIEIKQGPYQHD